MFELILKILFFPIWFPILLVLAVILFGFSIGVAVTGFAVFIIFASLFLSTIVIFFVGFYILFSNFFTGLLSFGLSLILLGFAILLSIFGIFLCSQMIPNLYKGINSMFKKMFSIKKSKKYNTSTKEITKYEEIN